VTAVNPTRLRYQINGLMANFSSPVEFHQKLQGIFSLYANYALRKNTPAPARPLIPMYHLPHPVLRQLNADLKPRIIADPAEALAVADELWMDDYYEVKHTAIYIIGNLPLENPDTILDRVQLWLTPDLDQVLKLDLLSVGTRPLQNSFPDEWESLILALLSQSEPEMIALGIEALTEGLKQPNFQNLPVVFRLASPFLREPHSAFTRDLKSLIDTLARYSPKETGFFLKQTLSVSTSPETTRLIKECLPSFPEEVQTNLRAAIKK
jgi:hypothetical protein